MAALPVIVAFSAAVANAQVIPVADLAVEKTAPAESAAGTNVPFAVTVLNNGPDPAVNAVVVDMVPAGTTFVSAVQNSGTAFTCTTPAGGSGSGSISCSCPSLASGTTATFTFVFHIDPSTAAGAFITNVASAASDTFDSNEENSSGSAVTQTPPPPVADMRVSKVGPGGANPNTNVTYTIELSNGGPGAATSVSLDDTIPGDMTVVSVTQTAGPALTCSNGAGGTVTCTAASFPAGATASLTVVGHIPSGTADGTTYVNFATVTSNFDPNSENDAATTLVCVQGDSCQAGACNGNKVVVCAAADQCQTPGTCNTVTGVCSDSVAKANGAACSDGDACTQTDTCQAGVCTGGNPVVCAAADQCHIQGACNPVTGTCAANPTKTDGAACNDGNGCTQSDSCQAGVCSGASPVVCPAPDQCHTQGTCNPVTGTCAANPAKSDGAVCDDGNACTQIDSCQAGVCSGASPVVCPAPDQCHTQGACNPGTGICAANPPTTNGAACNDGNVCTQTDSCQAGVCLGVTVSCDDGNSCTMDTCNSVMGCVHITACDAGVDAGDAGDGGDGGDGGDARADATDGIAADADGSDSSDGNPADATPVDTVPFDGLSADARIDGPGADARADVSEVAADRPTTDGRLADATTTDARPADAKKDAAGSASSDSGCGCLTAGAAETSGSLAWLFLLGLFLVRRRQPRRPDAPTQTRG